MNAQRRKALKQIVKDLEEAKDAAAKLDATLSDVKGDLESLRDEEQEYYDNMPESMQGGDKGDTAQTAINAMEEALSSLEDLDDLADKFDSAITSCEEAVQ